MRKGLAFVGALIFLGGSSFAKESVLIDFSELVPDDSGLHQPTILDYGATIGTFYTEEERAAMKMSLAIPEWEIVLTSSSRTPLNDSLSYVRMVRIKDESSFYPGQQVMGVRIHFPTPSFNGYAYIRPPFKIPFYYSEDDVDTPDYAGYGVVRNVGVIKSITATLLGRRHPNGFGIILRDSEGGERYIHFDNLEFSDWRELTWVNPNYIADVRHRELKMEPLYPSPIPAVALGSLVVYRDGNHEGGDFTSYVKGITLKHDLAVPEGVNRDVDDESIWGILESRERERRLQELKRRSRLSILRFEEQKKIHTGDEGEVSHLAEQEPPSQPQVQSQQPTVAEEGGQQ